MDVGSQEALMVIAVVISICWLECKCNWFFPLYKYVGSGRYHLSLSVKFLRIFLIPLN